ncbi:MAG: hypothetical protein SFV15_24785 [Polyangiaceae bacterium]|nr:hypothetical protein [Polyangiaceae bacterium]
MQHITSASTFLLLGFTATTLAGCSAGDDAYQNPNRAMTAPTGSMTTGAVPTGTTVVPVPTGTGAPTTPAPTTTTTSPNVTPTTTGTTPVVPAPTGGQALTPTATGWVDAGSNTLGIQGPWYSYNDCNDSPSDCTTNHMPPKGEFANVGGKMCTSGTTAQVKAPTEFSTKWGAGIALDLNNSGGAMAMKLPYNAASKGVKGFSFTLTGTAPGLRVNLPTPSTATDSNFKAGVVGQNTVLFTEAMQGSWVTTKTPIDASQVLSIQFQIPSTMQGAVAFDFCIENLKAITQ